MQKSERSDAGLDEEWARLIMLVLVGAVEMQREVRLNSSFVNITHLISYAALAVLPRHGHAPLHFDRSRQGVE